MLRPVEDLNSYFEDHLDENRAWHKKKVQQECQTALWKADSVVDVAAKGRENWAQCPQMEWESSPASVNAAHGLKSNPAALHTGYPCDAIVHLNTEMSLLYSAHETSLGCKSSYSGHLRVDTNVYSPSCSESIWKRSFFLKGTHLSCCICDLFIVKKPNC